MEKKIKKFEIEVEVEYTYEFTDKVREEAKKQGIKLPCLSGLMACNVKGMKRQVRQSIAAKNWKDQEDLDMLLLTYAQLWINEQLGIESTPIREKVVIDKMEDVPKRFLEGDD